MNPPDPNSWSEPHFPKFNLGMAVKHKLQAIGTGKNNLGLISLGKNWWIKSQCVNISWEPQPLLTSRSPTSPALQQDEELEAISVLGVREGTLDHPGSAGMDQEPGTDFFGILCLNLNFWHLAPRFCCHSLARECRFAGIYMGMRLGREGGSGKQLGIRKRRGKTGCEKKPQCFDWPSRQHQPGWRKRHIPKSLQTQIPWVTAS